MAKVIDLTGKQFGLLYVLGRAENDKNGSPKWLCLCECGNEKVVYGSSLRYGITRSCGCKSNVWNADSHKTHGGSDSKLYGVWRSMKYRCNNEKCHAYKDYGGRGINVCTEWNDNYVSFYEWAMSSGYTDGLTIDRINVNDGYNPANCRWVTRKVQANNQRNNHPIEYNGEMHNMSEWAEITGISYSAISKRISAGWSTEKALTTPTQQRIIN